MDDLEVSGLTIPATALTEVFETSGGPGGQHANRNETSVRLRLDVLGASLPEGVTERILARLGESVEVTASDSRSQWRNRAIARRRMQEKIEEALVQAPPRRRTRRTRASHRRRLADKRARGEIKRLRGRPNVDD